MTKSPQSRFGAATIWTVVSLFVAVAGFGALFKLYSASPTAITRAAASDIFVDATEASGVNFVHTNGLKGEYYFAEITGSGVSGFDYDIVGLFRILMSNG